MIRTEHQLALDLVRVAATAAANVGGDGLRARHLTRGKMLPLDRVANVFDPGSPF